MAKWRIATVLMLGVVLITGCSVFDKNSNSLEIKASGRVVTEEPALADFDRVDAAHTFDVTVTQGDTFAVLLRVDENVQEYLDVRVDGDTLYLSLKKRDGGYSFQGDVTLEAEVTMPALRGIGLSGVSKGAVTGFDTESAFDAQLSGASRLTGDITAGDVAVDASGASRVNLAGSAAALTLNLSGASKATLYGFTVSGDADVDASGASHAEVTVNGTLNVDASGASDVRYRGDATLGAVDESGTSTVAAGD